MNFGQYTGENDHEHEHGNPVKLHSTLIHKLVCLLIFFVMTFLAGIVTINCHLSRRNKRIVTYLNTARGSVGLASTFFLTLPLAADHFKDFFDHENNFNHIIKRFPWSFAIVLIVYIFSLVLLRLVFSLESTNEHSHVESSENHHHHHSNTESKRGTEKSEEQEEEAFKNIVGSRGRFATYMGIEKIKHTICKEGKDLVVSKRSSVVRASLIISKQFLGDQEEMKVITNDTLSECNENCKEIDLCNICHQIELNSDNCSSNVDNAPNHKHSIDRRKISLEILNKNNHDHNRRSVYFGYFLMLIVAIQGFFIGVSFGTLDHLCDLLSFGMVMLIYKCTEQISMGIVLREAVAEKSLILRQALLQSICVPMGIAIGTVIQPSLIEEAIIYSITSGILLYQTASESIIEEFSFTNERFKKFFVYLASAIFVAFITCLTHLN